MKWFYAENGEQRGPCSVDELRAALNNGRLTRETLVWREGMAGWLPYHEAMRATGETVEAVEITETMESLAGSTGLSLASPIKTGERTGFAAFNSAATPSQTRSSLSLGIECPECQRLWSEDEVVLFGTTPVCA